MLQEGEHHSSGSSNWDHLFLLHYSIIFSTLTMRLLDSTSLWLLSFIGSSQAHHSDLKSAQSYEKLSTMNKRSSEPGYTPSYITTEHKSGQISSPVGPGPVESKTKEPPRWPDGSQACNVRGAPLCEHDTICVQVSTMRNLPDTPRKCVPKDQVPQDGVQSLRS
ncbi:hypothetical protein BT63DRAFT_287912 [Microthyrium microscopicum]|uniref:Uncharacterized protein n=1 Tax=Microthyrium microscopicum TaxID=703497 RepID=A0A6A6U9M1_9PEZI|nr:hypothetical protein BT63DRAFT_287912 [Microthyrium microscopicum]